MFSLFSIDNSRFIVVVVDGFAYLVEAADEVEGLVAVVIEAHVAVVEILDDAVFDGEHGS